MDGELYTQILEDELQQSLEYYGKEVADIIFQQDNDTKHKSKLLRRHLISHLISDHILSCLMNARPTADIQ